jgi:probable selenium-dependent hydroxylase accessory protein YqeC
VVLAAGRGERFGGGKLKAELAGRPLITWAVGTALLSGLDRVLVVLGDGAENLAALLPDDPRLEILVNPRHQEGMGTSLACAAARASQAGAAVLAVLLGDMPLVGAPVLAAVAQAARTAPGGAAAARAAGQRGHPVAFAQRHFSELARLSGDQGGRALLERLGHGLALVEVPPQSLLDVDRPLDLAQAAALLDCGQARPGLKGLASALGLGLGLDHPGLWALVGSGGKTSLLYALAAELAGQGQAVVVTTTTHIYPPRAGQADGPWLLAKDLPSLPQMAHRLAPGRPLCLAAHRQADGKLEGLSREQIAALLMVPGLWVLSEGDGAAGRPLKGWADHEPALTGLEVGVVVLAGASGLGRPISPEWAHRPRELARACGLEVGQTMTPAALAEALGGGQGPLRRLPAGVLASVLVNQAENAPPALLRQLGAALAGQGRWRAMLRASLRMGWWRDLTEQLQR